MKLVIQPRKFMTVCRKVRSILPGVEVNPILSNLHVAISKEEKCFVSGTDTEIGLRCQAPDVYIDGAKEDRSFLLPADPVLKILHEMNDDTVTIEVGDKIRLLCTAGKFELPASDVNKYPLWPDFPIQEAANSLDAEEFKTILQRVNFCLAEADGRYTLAGCCFDHRRGKIHLVSTDSKRMSVHPLPSTVPPEDGITPIVPDKALGALIANLDTGLVSWTFRDNDALFQTETFALYTRLVDGRFPNWRAAMPKDFQHVLTFQAGTLLRAIRQAAVLVDQSHKVTFIFANQQLELRTSGTGQSEVRLPVVYNKELRPIKTSYNPRFWIQALSLIPPDEEITLNIVDAVQPFLMVYGPWQHVFISYVERPDAHS